MAADRDDEQGVLGNLPRSRPGRRSAKRGSTTGAARKAPAKKAAARKPAARKTAAKAQPPPRPRPTAAPQRKSGDDPIGQAVQLAGKVAALGVRTAADIVKRLPRP